MNRSKLEYLIKYFPVEQQRIMITEIDPDGDYNFGFLTKKFLKNPDSKDPFVLIAVPNYEDPASVEEYKEKYVKQFEKINEICIKNNIPPFFKKPSNLVESETIREDICMQVHESILNKFFKVKSFYDFKPPFYQPENKN